MRGGTSIEVAFELVRLGSGVIAGTALASAGEGWEAISSGTCGGNSTGIALEFESKGSGAAAVLASARGVSSRPDLGLVIRTFDATSAGGVAPNGAITNVVLVSAG